MHRKGQIRQVNPIFKHLILKLNFKLDLGHFTNWKLQGIALIVFKIGSISDGEKIVFRKLDKYFEWIHSIVFPKWWKIKKPLPDWERWRERNQNSNNALPNVFITNCIIIAVCVSLCMAFENY